MQWTGMTLSLWAQQEMVMDEGTRDEKIAKGCLNTLIFLLPILVVFFLNATSSDSGSSDDRTRILWKSYDVEIVVSEDGNLHVTERQDVRFHGPFSEGYARIPLDRVGSMDNVQVMTENAPEDRDNNGFLSNDEADAAGEMIRGTKVRENTLFLDPGEYRVVEENGELLIEYGFETTSTSAGSVFAVPQTRTIILEYDVTGAIRDYPDAQEPWQQLHWMAISDEVTEVADIQQATVTVTLPQDVEGSQLSFVPTRMRFRRAISNGPNLRWMRGIRLTSRSLFRQSPQRPPRSGKQPRISEMRQLRTQ